jgi:hypothetical protein
MKPQHHQNTVTTVKQLPTKIVVKLQTPGHLALQMSTSTFDTVINIIKLMRVIKRLRDIKRTTSRTTTTDDVRLKNH